MSISRTENAASEGYIFTSSQDWFTYNIPIWEPYIDNFLSTLPVGRAPRALEIGSWEGRSAVYILTKICNTPDSLLVCIDHFDLLSTPIGRERHATVVHNLTLTGSPFRIVADFSLPALMTLLNEQALASQDIDGGFDFVYIDGSHEPDDTFLDGELVWRLTRLGGLIIFDDYKWPLKPASSMHHPARGIDAFITLHEGQFELLHKDHQVILRKTVNMRIGFLHKSVLSNASESNPFECDLYVVMLVTSSYAMAAAVALRSAIDATSGRIMFYIFDYGLQPEEKLKLEASIPQARTYEVTIWFQTPLPGSRGIKDPFWAKLDLLMHPSLPYVDRIIYLDADVLVRRDLKDLLRTDIGGKSLGAVRDIALPLGPPGLFEADRGRNYFNSGVLLVDLNLFRQRIPEMNNALATLQETLYKYEFKDQDFLNVFFPDFYELDIVWNATGLGTYASWSSTSWASVDRDNTWPQGLATLLADPAIVHFNGPVHPSMFSVLNSSCQPWLGKPWGYSGAPGNPFMEHWWEVLEKTAWKGIRQDKTFKESLILAKKAVVEDALAEFERRVSVYNPLLVNGVHHVPSQI